MLDKLIVEGQNLKSQIKVSEAFGIKESYLTGENFEKWASKVVLYLEDYYPGKALTDKAIGVYKNLGTDSVRNYEFLLGAIKGVKEYESEQEVDFEVFE